MEKKKYFDELNIFRALIIVWVIIGHSFDAEKSVLGFLHEYGYTFHMSAFFILSGFLFASKLNRISSIKESAIAVLDRAKRLLVPYLFFTMVSYVLKMFFESYANNELSSNIILDTLLCQKNPNGGLWFLYTLFLLSAIFILLRRINKYVLFAISAILKIVIILTDIQFAPLAYTMNFAVYFSIGLIFKDFYDKLSNNILNIAKSKKALFGISTVVLLCVSLVISYLQIYTIKNKFFLILVCIFNIIVWYLIAIVITNSSIIQKPFKVIGEYGMDIYMLGYYVQIAIRVVLGSMLGTPYVIYSILMCVLGLIIPIPFSKFIVRKIPLARAIMLGDFKKKVKK